MSRPAKRARTDGDAVTAYSPEQLTEMLISLTADAQAKMLVEAAAAHPDVAAKIASAHRAKINRDQAAAASEAARPQNFGPHYDKAFDQMYAKHERLSGSRQYDMGFEVAFGIEDNLGTIACTTTAACPYETKFRAIESIRTIFALIEGNGEIARIVCQNTNTYDWGSKLIRVIKTFSPEELDRLRNAEVEGKGPGSWMKLFEVTVEMARDYCLEDGLHTDEAWGLLAGGA